MSDLGFFTVATDEARQLEGQIVRHTGERSQGRKFRGQACNGNLKQTDGPGKIFESVLSYIPQRRIRREIVSYKFACRLGNKDLATVSGSANASRSVNAYVDVTGLSAQRLTGIDAYPNAHISTLGPGMGRDLALCGDTCPDGIPGTREDNEEAIAVWSRFLAYPKFRMPNEGCDGALPRP
ncbi:MAG: hypothetical protein ACRDIC_03340 [bacterium]